jgi:hypothetical protein
VDLGGENLRNLAAVASNTPGQSRTAASELVTGRKAGAPERVGQDVARSISPNKDYSGTFDALVDARSGEAAPLYEKAFGWQGGGDERLQRFIDEPTLKEGFKRGYNMLRREAVARNESFDPTMLGVSLNEAGEPVFAKVPNMRVLDAGKRGLDDMLEAYRDPTTGRLRLTPEGRSVDELRRAYLTHLDGLNPDYGAARQAYAGRTDSMEAMALGRDILRADSDVTAKQITALAPGDREFLRAGVAKAIMDKVENTADGRDVVASFFNKPALRKKLEAAFDTPEQFKAFEEAMKREMSMAATNNQISPRANSHTFRLGAGAEDLQRDPGVFENLLQKNWMGALNAAKRGSQTMNSDTADALAPLLYSTDPRQNMATLLRVGGARPKVLSNDAKDAIARALTGPLPVIEAGDFAGSPRQRQ